MAETCTNRPGNNPQEQAANAGMEHSTAAHAPAVVKETASAVSDKAHEIVADVGRRVQHTASDLAQEARQAVATVGSKADGAISSVGEGMSSLAGTVRDKLPHEGTLGSTAGAVVDQLDATGAYLQEHGLSDMGKDLTDVIRKYPVPALFVALGVGLLLGRTRR